MRMAKMASVLCGCILASAMCSYATVAISWNWDSDAGAAVQDHLGAGSLPVGNIIQLIWTAGSDPNPGAFDDANPLSIAAGDLLLEQRTLAANPPSEDAGYWMYTGTYGAAGALYGGYVYQRVFEDFNGGGIGAGDYYRNGQISGGGTVPLVDADGIPAPVADASNFFSSGGSPINVDVLIVPEPATMGLFGLGLVIMALRRKIRG